MPAPGSSSTGKFIVVGVVGIILIAIGAIVVRNVINYGGYPWEFSAIKSRGDQPGHRPGNSAITGAGSDEGNSDQGASRPAYTLRFLDDDGQHEASPDAFGQHLVLLVHGLDDPGWTWNTMIESLVGADHDVARFDYPNDQGIADSADLLARALIGLKGNGVDRVSVVAHSMGGLVARDVLTRPAYYNGDGLGSSTLPEIDHLMMLGTPNNGSQLARLRGLGEIGEQLSRMWSGERDPFRFLADGNGEAGTDLIPGSEYLMDLNARPLAGHTKYTIVAGRVSPLDESGLVEWVERVDSKLPKFLRDKISNTDKGKMAEALAELVGGVGDGAVSLASARLAGVDDVVEVEADHMSMVVTLLDNSRLPPAIPIVLDRLGGDPADIESDESGGD